MIQMVWMVLFILHSQDFIDVLLLLIQIVKNYFNQYLFYFYNIIMLNTLFFIVKVDASYEYG